MSFFANSNFFFETVSLQKESLEKDTNFNKQRDKDVVLK